MFIESLRVFFSEQKLVHKTFAVDGVEALYFESVLNFYPLLLLQTEELGVSVRSMME